MNISNNNNITSTGAADSIPVCANCGKEGSDVNNICNKCKIVKYCNAACKKKHRHKHKKECEEHIRLAAEHAAKLHDEKLFKQPPPLEDCPICFQQLPVLKRVVHTRHVVGKLYVVGVIMHLNMIIKAIELMMTNKTSVHFAELWLLNQRMRW